MAHEAVGTPRATIPRIQEDAATGSFTWTRMLRFETIPKRARSKQLQMLLAYDGEALTARDTKIGDELRIGSDPLAYDADVFFPLGG
ncbi:MAG: hypothetical protein J0I67_14635 [Bosea sp.]|nr:hypothetical protein [Bosea sp. (in: a-proteobacteria)]